MPSYPTTCGFPIPYNGGFKLAPKKALTSVTTESRNSRSKSLITNNVYVVNFTFTFQRQSDRDTFRQWFLYEIGYGNMWFNASWLTEFGFTAGDWVFRFTNPISIDLTGYKDSFQATLLMGPKNQNTIFNVNPLNNFIESGIGGQYIDQDYPFGSEPYQCLDNLSFTRIVRPYSNSSMAVNDFNGSNYTQVGNDFNFTVPPLFAMVYGESMSEDTLAMTTASPTTNLRMFKFDGTNFNLLGTVNPSNNSLMPIARLSFDTVAVYCPDAFNNHLRTYQFNFTTNLWSQVGASFSLAYCCPSNDIAAMCSLGNNRIAFIQRGTNVLAQQSAIRTFEFNGSWSQIGTPLPVANSLLSEFSLCALSSTKIVLNASTFNAFNKKFAIFDSASLGVWSLTSTSQDINGGTIMPMKAFGNNKIVCFSETGLVDPLYNGLYTTSLQYTFAYQLTGTTWTPLGLPNSKTPPAGSRFMASYYPIT